MVELNEDCTLRELAIEHSFLNCASAVPALKPLSSLHTTERTLYCSQIDTELRLQASPEATQGPYRWVTT